MTSAQIKERVQAQRLAAGLSPTVDDPRFLAELAADVVHDITREVAA